MKRTWTIQRTMVKRADGQRRWDRAYQRLLEWTRETETVSTTDTDPTTPQEEEDESGHLRSCIDLTPTKEPNY